LPELDGQYAGALQLSIIAGASCDTSRYSVTRSTLLKSSSSCAAALISCLLASANIPACTMTTAAEASSIPDHRAKKVAAKTTMDPRPEDD